MGTVLKATPAPNWAPIRASRMSDAATVALGTIGALTLGVLARLWMRLISEHPEFTWSGTIGILVGFTIFGLTQSVAALARRRQWRRWPTRFARVAGVVGILPLFMAAGGLMMPAVVGGGLAVWRADWTKAMRAVPALLAMADVGFVSKGIMDDFGWSARSVAGIVAMVVVYGAIVWAARATFASAVKGSARGERAVGTANR